MSDIVRQTITKKDAEKYLKKNVKNRKLSRKVYDNYTAAMNRGEWKLSPHPICFDVKGNLIDGQHRLTALIKSKMESLDFYVALNQEEDVFMILDTGKKRVASDVLGIEGFKSTVLLAAALKYLHLYDQGIEDERINATRYISTQQVLETVKNNPNIIESLNFIAALSVRKNSAIKIPEPSFLVFLHHIYKGVDAAKADSFMMKLSDGLGLNANDPVYLLRNIIIKDSGATFQMRSVEKRALIIKALNLYMKDKKISNLKWQQGRGGPRSDNSGNEVRKDPFPTVLSFPKD